MLEDFIRKIEDLNGSHEVPFCEIFTDEFMLFNTDFRSISEMITASGFVVQTSGDLARIPDAEWDKHICEHSRFSSWEEMKGAAVKLWVARKLGLEGS